MIVFLSLSLLALWTAAAAFVVAVRYVESIDFERTSRPGVFAYHVAGKLYVSRSTWRELLRRGEMKPGVMVWSSIPVVVSDFLPNGDPT